MNSPQIGRLRLRTVAILVIGLWLSASTVLVTQFLRGHSAAPSHWVRGELREKLVLQSVALNFPASLLVVAAAPAVPMGDFGILSEWVPLSVAGLAQWVLFFSLLHRVGQRSEPAGAHTPVQPADGRDRS